MGWIVLLFSSILLFEDEPAAFEICSLCEASQPASSDYNGQIDFFFLPAFLSPA